MLGRVAHLRAAADLWTTGGLRDRVLGMIAELRIGDVTDFANFMGAVIDEKSFDNIGDYLAHAKKHLRSSRAASPTRARLVRRRRRWWRAKIRTRSS